MLRAWNTDAHCRYVETLDKMYNYVGKIYLAFTYSLPLMSQRLLKGLMEILRDKALTPSIIELLFPLSKSS